jgi:spoIIIJ-associated protein
MEWVEASGKTEEVAIEAALAELGMSSVEQAQVETLQEAKPGLFGLGGQDAIVKVSRKPHQPKRKRRRRRGKGGGENQQGPPKAQAKKRPKSKSRPQQERPRKKSRGRNGEESAVTAPEVNIEDQAALAKEFLEGLLESFGLEGEVSTRVEDDILFLDVAGGQTEALIGPKGQILQAVHDLTRTVIQRKTFRAPRMRLDIGGYTERRRAALKIFAGQIAEKVLEGGGEIMLEAMNPADRKVLHDAVAEIEGVRSFSEGEDPRRSVVIAPVGD